MMRTSGFVRCFLAALLLAITGAACENPFDPLDTADEIRGLSYIDFSLVWDRWDSDPEYDGVIVSVEFFNTFNDSLSFQDKPTRVVVEFWTQGTAGGVENEQGEIEGGTPTNGELLFSWPVEISYADDEIRIPKEAYEPALRDEGLIRSSPVDEEGNVVDQEAVSLFVIVRVFPPKALPKTELVAFYPDQLVWEPPEGVINPETAPPEEATL